MPILAFILTALVFFSTAFNGKDTLLHGFGKMQNAMGAAFQSFQLPVGSLLNWNHRPPGSLFRFEHGEFTSTEYLDWYLYNKTASAWLGGPLRNVSSLEWFVEEGFLESSSLVGPDRDSWFELNKMSPWNPSEDSSPTLYNATDSRLRCFIEVEERFFSSASRFATRVGSPTASLVKPTLFSTSAPESSIAWTELPSAAKGAGPTTTARCFVGQEYVASATGTFALPTSFSGGSAYFHGAHGSCSIASPTGPFMSSVSSDDSQGSKWDAESGFLSRMFAYLETIREFLGLPQHKFYPIIILPIPALFAWWIDGGFQKEMDQEEPKEEDSKEEESKEQEAKEEPCNSEDGHKRLRFDVALPPSGSIFLFEEDAPTTPWVEAELIPSPLF